MIDNEPTTTPPLIYDLDFNTIQDLITSINEPSYRAKQLWHGLYKNLWGEFDQFTNFPTHTRNKLTQVIALTALSRSAQYR